MFMWQHVHYGYPWFQRVDRSYTNKQLQRIRLRTLTNLNERKMSTENNELQLSAQNAPAEITFGNSQQFEHAQRVAKMLSASNLIPKEFQNNVQNTMIALEMANRIGASPLMVMQNLYIVHGKPSWSSTFIISAINACGRFSPLRFDLKGSGETLECTAWALDKRTNERLDGVKVTMQMAIAEGWVGKAGSKWKTMPELMIRYRSAAFFGRLYAPDILMGMHTVEEVDDFTAMMTFEQEQQIESLMGTSSYDNRQQRTIKFQLANGISQGKAYEIIQDLRNNQLPAITHSQNYSQGDIKDHNKNLG